MYADINSIGDIIKMFTLVEFPLKILGSSIGLMIDIPDRVIKRKKYTKSK